MSIFRFKQFTINQANSAMKIGTDAVLLGAWTPVHNPATVLDIGTGTGILALMMAQRTQAEQIDGIEIEPLAYEQTVENFENSPWNDRLFCYHADILELANDPEIQYDLIISNPPFYNTTYQSPDKNRNIARMTDALSFEKLLFSVNALLEDEGAFSVIVPYVVHSDFIALAENYHLYPTALTHVKGNIATDYKRSLIYFKRQPVEIHPQMLVIEIERHIYTEDYKRLTEAFYL